MLGKTPKLENVKKEKYTDAVIDLTLDEDVIILTSVTTDSEQCNKEPKGALPEASITKPENDVKTSVKEAVSAIVARQNETPSESFSAVVEPPITLIAKDPASAIITTLSNPKKDTQIIDNHTQSSQMNINATTPPLDDFSKDLLECYMPNQKPRVWNDEDKRFSLALVFRYSLDGTSAMHICRAASKKFVCCIHTR